MLDLALISALAFLFLGPVLLSPHFGLFSDYGQLLAWPASSLHNLPKFFRELRPLGDGRWTPMFHLVTVAAYGILGPNAFLFFLVQGLTLIASLALVYLLVRWMSAGSRSAGIAACLLILISAPLAENYFTLDKVEPRVVFFSLFSIGYFALRLAGPRPGLWKAMLLHFALAVLLVFSKETGSFLAVAAFLVLCATLLRFPRDTRMVRESLAYFAATLSVLVLFVVLNNALVQGDAKILREQNGGLGRYITYQISSRLVAANLMGYLGQMREVILAILLFAVWVVWTVLRRRKSTWDSQQILLFLTGASGSIYLGGMLLWRFTLLYYMLPVVFFFAMASMAVVFRQKHTLRGWLFFLALLFLARVHLDQRIRTGWAILAQDRAKDLIVQAIRKHASDRTRVAVGMFDVRSAEIGRSLQAYLGREGLHMAEGPPSEAGTRVYSLIEGPWVNFSDTHRYDGSEAEPPTTEEMDQARALSSPYVLWQYAPLPEIGRVWWMNPLSPGDLLALPVGTPDNLSIPARGISAFSASSEGIRDTRLAGVATKLLETAVVPFPFYRNEYLGWELFEVTQVTPQLGRYAGLDHFISTNAAQREPQLAYLGTGWSPLGWTPAGEPYRWGYNNAQIFAPRDSSTTATLDLEPNGQLGLPLTIRAIDSAGRELARWPLLGRLKVELAVDQGRNYHLADTRRDQSRTRHDLLQALWTGGGKVALATSES